MKRLATILTLGLLLIISTTADASQTQVSSRPRIVGHRGTCTDRPECTLAALQRAIDAGAQVVEIDVRTSKDGVLFLLHDSTLDRTTDGSGAASLQTMAELKQLDAGGWLDEEYRGERIPTLGEALQLCHDKIDVLLDLKEQGEVYAKAVARDVTQHGNPARSILGVRSVEQARQFRRLLPNSRQLGFIPDPQSIEAFVEAGVDMVRLWPRWLTGSEGTALVERVRSSGTQLQINGTVGTPQDVLPLLRYRPDMLLVDDPAALKATLNERAQYTPQLNSLAERVVVQTDDVAIPWVARRQAPSFLNRDYHMLEFPETLREQPRLVFTGGEGDRVVLSFTKPAVVFAAFEYNTTGKWSFPEGHSPESFGWNLVKKGGYRGTSNAMIDGQPHSADLFSHSFQAGERLEELPPWWLCVAIVDLQTARSVPGFSQESPHRAPPFLYSQWTTRPRPLHVPDFATPQQWASWQRKMRERFRQQLVFPYQQPLTIVPFGKPLHRSGFTQHEFHVVNDGKRLFRFFKLTPDTMTERQATIVCFMGHGKVRQVLQEPDSYQHACAARFAERGYIVFAMENVGMEPDGDTHHELDRLLRLDGYGWYSLLFAHQQILLNHVFADPIVDVAKVGVTGVSTGGLLALSAIAMEPRVAAASIQGIFASMRVSFIQDRDRHCPCGAIPGLLPDFDLPEMALLAAPRPLHISNATQDGFGPAEAKRQVERIASHYRSAGGQTPRFSSAPGRHEYAFEPALKFFDETIGRPTASFPLDTDLTWIETPADQPVIDRGPVGAWDHYAVDNPFVLIDGNELYCFYEAQDKPFDQGGSERIGLAISRDGIHWSKTEQNPILDVGPPDAWDSLVAKLPVVSKHNGKFYMFYSGRDGKTKQIGLATSDDRIHWKKAPSNPVLASRADSWDRFISTYPAPLIIREDTFFLVYRGMTSLYRNQGMGLAESSNLTDWTRAANDPVIPVGEEVASMAMAHSGEEYVGISQSPHRQYWSSKDLRTWTKGKPVKFTGPHVDTLSNPFLVGSQWQVLYEQEDRIYRAVLGTAP